MGVVLVMHATPCSRLKAEVPLSLRHHQAVEMLATQQQVEALRKARQDIADCWRMRAESRRIQRGYEERQRKIEDLMRRYDVERA